MRSRLLLHQRASGRGAGGRAGKSAAAAAAEGGRRRAASRSSKKERPGSTTAASAASPLLAAAASVVLPPPTTPALRAAPPPPAGRRGGSWLRARRPSLEVGLVRGARAEGEGNERKKTLRAPLVFRLLCRRSLGRPSEFFFFCSTSSNSLFLSLSLPSFFSSEITRSLFAPRAALSSLFTSFLEISVLFHKEKRACVFGREREPSKAEAKNRRRRRVGTKNPSLSSRSLSPPPRRPRARTKMEGAAFSSPSNSFLCYKLFFSYRFISSYSLPLSVSRNVLFTA